MGAAHWTILNYAFRPFFSLAPLFSVVVMLLWLAGLHGAEWAPRDPMWHAHEMLFGFGLAIVAGFLLTAVATWTGRPQVSGPLLGVLVVAWFAGRLGMLFAGTWPPAFVAVLDLAFPVLLAILAAREIFGGSSRRNFGISAVTAVMALFNLCFHLGRDDGSGIDRVAVFLMAHTLLVMITVIGGRIIPSFTANWLRFRGVVDMPRSRPWVENTLVPVTIAAGIADSIGAQPIVVAIPCLAAAALHAMRVAGWRGPSTRTEPLLAVLHVAYAWLPLGYLLLGLTALGMPLPRSAALHALTMGGIGTMILAVTTRVALGHTGRALAAAPLTVAAYFVLNAAVLVRILSALAPSAYLPLIDVAAAGWVTAFGLFLWVYWPILTRPRIDGRPERRTAT